MKTAVATLWLEPLSILLVALALLCALIALIAPCFKRMRDYIRNVTTCGYLASAPKPGAVRFLRFLARIMVGIQVGRITVIGKENLKRVRRKIITPNHPHYIDPGVITLVIKEPARYMAASGVAKFAWGLGALIGGPCGVFSVDLTPGKGGPAKDAAVRAVTGGEMVVMFPEGWAYVDGSSGPYKTGAVRIATESAEKLNEPVYLIPVHLRYGRYPGRWIRKIGPPMEYLVLFLLFWLYRRGVTVVIGEPISSADLPDDPRAATEILKERILSLDPQGREDQNSPA